MLKSSESRVFCSFPFTLEIDFFDMTFVMICTKYMFRASRSVESTLTPSPLGLLLTFTFCSFLFSSLVLLGLLLFSFFRFLLLFLLVNLAELNVALALRFVDFLYAHLSQVGAFTGAQGTCISKASRRKDVRGLNSPGWLTTWLVSQFENVGTLLHRRSVGTKVALSSQCEQDGRTDNRSQPESVLRSGEQTTRRQGRF